MTKPQATALATLVGAAFTAATYFFPQYAVAFTALAATVPSPLSILLTREPQ